MRRILHDFYNPVCIETLKNTVTSMGPDLRLIVCDMLVPEMAEVGKAKVLCFMDYDLMLLSSKEKIFTEFNELLEATGLTLVKIYPSEIRKTVMLETKLKASSQKSE